MTRCLPPFQVNRSRPMEDIGLATCSMARRSGWACCDRPCCWHELQLAQISAVSAL
jgi:hypothetical protein